MLLPKYTDNAQREVIRLAYRLKRRETALGVQYVRPISVLNAMCSTRVKNTDAAGRPIGV